jgi:hypothetical protein
LKEILGDKVAGVPALNAKGSNSFAFHPSKTSTGESFLLIKRTSAPGGANRIL